MRECLSRSMSPESDHTTARGMEHVVSSKAVRKLLKAKAAVIKAVLDVQDCQCASSVNDPNALAVMSSALSLEARNTGIAKAYADQEYVLREQQKHCMTMATTRSHLSRVMSQIT